MGSMKPWKERQMKEEEDKDFEDGCDGGGVLLTRPKRKQEGANSQANINQPYFPASAAEDPNIKGKRKPGEDDSRMSSRHFLNSSIIEDSRCS